MKITPKNIQSLKANEIFVFGSNTAGRHGKGAALTALQKFGAKYGQDYGLQGKSFAIPTCNERFRPLSLDVIKYYVNSFLAFSKEHPELFFYVTEIGCGLAGYTAKDIAPFFYSKVYMGCETLNLAFPYSFYEEENQYLGYRKNEI